MRCSLRFAAYLFLLSILAQGCLLAPVPLTAEQPRQQHAAAMAQSYEAVDTQLAQTVAQYRALSLTAPGSPAEARAWAGVLEAAYEAGTVTRGKVDGAAHARELSGALDAAAGKHPAEAGELLAMKGRVQLRAGLKAEGVTTLRASLSAKPSTTALLPLIAELDAQGARAEVIPLCEKVRPSITSDDERYLLLERCLRHGGGASAEQGLAWAGPADIAFYSEQQRQAEARAAARAQAQDEYAQKMMAESQAREREQAARRAAQQARYGQQEEPGIPRSTTIRVINECSQTVRVFFGRQPKYGSGRESRVSGNSRSNEPRNADGSFVMWIIDERGEGISSVEAGPSQDEVVINPSCTGFGAR
jgi:hypothetical protein